MRNPQSGPAGRRRRTVGRVALLATVALLVAACGEAPQSVLDPRGPNAEQPDDLFRFVLLVALAVFIVVQGLIVYAVIRYRDRGDDTLPKQTHGNTRLEIVWTMIPAVIMAGVAVPTIATVFDLAEEDPDAIEIEVIGHRWWWEFVYPGMATDGGDIVTANEMVLPVDTPITLRMTSLESGSADNAVIHSYWIPALAGKQDVVPGRITTLNLEASETGVFMGACTEYCGLSHANMRNYATVVTAEEFDQWLDEQSRPAPQPPEGSLAAEGAALFVDTRQIAGLGERNCASCHAIDGYEGPGGELAQGNVGPNLTHLYSREMFAGAIYDLYSLEDPDEWGTWDRDDPDIDIMTEWLLNAPELKAMRATAETGAVGMPNLGLTPDEARALAEYLVTLQ